MHAINGGVQIGTDFYDIHVDLVLDGPTAIDMYGDQVGVYWIRIYRSTTTAVVIVADVPANPGRSPTNAASLIARHVLDAYLADVQDAGSVRWFLCYPGGCGSPQTRYSEVKFSGADMEPGWFRAGQSVSRATIEAAIGGVLRLLPPHNEVLNRVLAAGGK